MYKILNQKTSMSILPDTNSVVHAIKDIEIMWYKMEEVKGSNDTENDDSDISNLDNIFGNKKLIDLFYERDVESNVGEDQETTSLFALIQVTGKFLSFCLVKIHAMNGFLN